MGFPEMVWTESRLVRKACDIAENIPGDERIRALGICAVEQEAIVFALLRDVNDTSLEAPDMELLTLRAEGGGSVKLGLVDEQPLPIFRSLAAPYKPYSEQNGSIQGLLSCALGIDNFSLEAVSAIDNGVIKRRVLTNRQLAYPFCLILKHGKYTQERQVQNFLRTARRRVKDYVV